MRVGTHHPQPIRMDFLKHDKSPLEAVLKNHTNHRKIIK
jgi:hypothetical protein